jgi:hypothetical protein
VFPLVALTNTLLPLTNLLSAFSNMALAIRSFIEPPTLMNSTLATTHAPIKLPTDQSTKEEHDVKKGQVSWLASSGLASRAKEGTDVRRLHSSS